MWVLRDPHQPKEVVMPADSNHDDEQSSHLDSQEKEVTTMAVRLPIVILVAVLLMLGAGVLAVKMHGG
jgi:uncharacterized Tic20 family protein